jgi:hypothetical protein
LVQLRVDLKEARRQKEDIEAAVEIGRIEQHRNKRGSSRDLQSSYAKLKMELETNNSKLALVQILLHNAEEKLVKVCMELQEEKRKHDEDCREWWRKLQEEKRKHAEDCREWRTELQEQKTKHEVECSELRTDLQEEKRKHEVDFRELCADLQQVNIKNEERIKGMTEEIKGLKRSMELRLFHMECLKETIRKGTTAYDAMVGRVENIDRTTDQQRTAQSLRTNKAVCRAFGWSLENADPHLLRAACGFWESTTMDSEEYAEDNERVSLKMRENIWYELTCLGFKGKVLKKMEQGWNKLHKFDVVELARRSDVDSRFNSRSLGARDRTMRDG